MSLARKCRARCRMEEKEARSEAPEPYGARFVPCQAKPAAVSQSAVAAIAGGVEMRTPRLDGRTCEPRTAPTEVRAAGPPARGRLSDSYVVPNGRTTRRSRARKPRSASRAWPACPAPDSPSMAHDGPSHDRPAPKSSNRHDGPATRWSTATKSPLSLDFVAQHRKTPAGNSQAGASGLKFTSRFRDDRHFAEAGRRPVPVDSCQSSHAASSSGGE